MYLALRTDSDQAQIRLVDASGKIVAKRDWLAGRQLAESLLQEVVELLKSADSDWENLSGVIVFSGSGSFTGLRIGITVANTIAYGQTVPIVGQRDDSWLVDGYLRLANGQNDKQVTPFYGAEPNITKPKR